MNARTAILGTLLLLGADAAAGRVQARDDTGETVELPAPAGRILSLAPHATELLFAAGAGSRVIAVVRGSDYPDAARALPVIGDVQAIDLERIVVMQPDLVVTWRYTTSAHVAKLRARGIPVFTSDPMTIEGIADDIESLGALAGTAAAARTQAAALRNRIAELRRETGGKSRISVFYEIWHAPLYTIGRNHLITQALTACGGRNVFEALNWPAPQVGIEAILAAAPEAIVAGVDRAERPAWLDDWRRWPQLPAVRYGNLEVVDADKLHRPGPRFVDGVAELCAALDRARSRMAGRP